MQWIRANRRFGAWCALVAVALQVVLSYGHRHRVAAIRSQFDAAISGAAVERHGPAPPQSTAFESCAVCAVIEMAATAVPPQAPAWRLPDVAGAAGFAPGTVAAPATAEHRLFHARGPPQAV